MLPAVNMTPVMAVRVRTVQMSAVLRVSLSPVLDDLPFIGGVALSFMTPPYLDFDLRYCPPYQCASLLPLGWKQHNCNASCLYASYAPCDVRSKFQSGFWRALSSRPSKFA